MVIFDDANSLFEIRRRAPADHFPLRRHSQFTHSILGLRRILPAAKIEREGA